jgi:outer membrane receptor protein involved in Fe transport
MPTLTKHGKSLLALAVGVLLASGPAYSQELDEITVTATKRDESIQDIPISITAISGDVLQRDVMKNLQDLAVTVPNLTISSGLTTDNIHIRGIGSGNERSFEQAVGMFIDNVYMPRSRQYRSPFLDVDRVEIARGPQAVLFGLNATAGAVAIHTARSRPGDDLVADLTAEYEAEYGGTALTAVVGGSPSETVGLRVAARILDTGDGYWENLTTGQKENSLKDTLLRGSIVWEPTDNVAVDVKVEFAEFERDGNVDELYTDAGGFSDGSDVLDWVRGQDASLLPLYPTPKQPGFDGELLNIAASVDVSTAGGGTITGTVGYSDYDWAMYLDLDSSPLQIIDSGIEEPYKQTSIELRYASSEENAIQFIGGAYLSTNELGQAQPNLVDGNIFLGAFGFPVTGFDAGRLWSNAQFNQEEDVTSVYGMLNWSVSDTVQIRGGVRYVDSKKTHERIAECLVRRTDGTFDELDLAGNPNDFLLSLIGFCPTIVTPNVQSRSSDNLLPEISAQWYVGESTMLYGKYGESAKSGGFVASTTIVDGFFEYDDETGTGFEFGLKTSFADGRGEFNIALFLTDYEDLQLNSFDPVTAASIIRNAGEVESKGVEIDARFAVSDAVTVGASIGFLNAEFTSFESGPCYPGEPVNPSDPGGGCNKTGMTLPYSPDNSGMAYVDINAPFGSNLTFLGGLDVNFSSDYLTDGTLDPLGRQSSYTKINARAGIGSADGKWRVSVIGKNLSEEKINNFTEAFLGVYRGYMQEPRTVWLQGRYSFGD